MIKIKNKYALSTESVTMTTTEETEPETALEDTEADTEPQVVSRSTTTEEPETDPELELEETEPDFVKTSTNKPRKFEFNDKYIETLAADQMIQDNLI